MYEHICTILTHTYAMVVQQVMSADTPAARPCTGRIVNHALATYS